MIISLLNKIIYSRELLYNEIIKSIEEGRAEIFTYLGFHCMNEFYINEKYASILLSESNVYAADSGLSMLLKIIGFKNSEKINGSNFNNYIMDFIKSTDRKIHIIGGKYSENDLLRIRENLSGYHPGFFNENYNEKLISSIQSSHSDLIIIGMGVPKQEFIAKMLIDRGVKRPILCVGNFMEFYLGTIKRAPKFLWNSGFEWMFRLLVEPKRLWRRYLIGIPQFIFRGFKVCLKNFASRRIGEITQQKKGKYIFNYDHELKKQ